MIEFWMKKQLVSDSNYNIVNIECPKKITRNDKYCKVLHLVLVTLHTRFTMKY